MSSNIDVLSQYGLNAYRYVVTLDDNVACTIPTGLNGDVKPIGVWIVRMVIPSGSLLKGYSWALVDDTNSVPTITAQFADDITGVTAEVLVVYER